MTITKNQLRAAKKLAYSINLEQESSDVWDEYEYVLHTIKNDVVWEKFRELFFEREDAHRKENCEFRW